MAEPSGMLRDFAAELMRREGAIVEAVEPHGLDFVAPTPLQQALKIAEFGRLGFGPDAPTDAERVTFESDWIQRFARVLADRGRACRRVLSSQPPPLSSPQRVLEHGFALQNSTHRLINVTAAWTRYLVLSFRYTALSDDKREGIVQLAINVFTSSTPDEFIGTFESAVSEMDPSQGRSFPPGVEVPPLWNRDRLIKVLRVALPDRIRRSLNPFLRGIERRLERDATRLFDYYNGLREELLNRIRKQLSDAEREKARIAAIHREYQAKVADLEQKYALNVEVEPIQTLELVTPVRRFELLIKRRKKERRLYLDWNPLARKIEKPPCEYSYTSEPGRMVCDEALHLVSLDGHSPCPSCGKDYCRACHPLSCPKCGRLRR